MSPVTGGRGHLKKLHAFPQATAAVMAKLGFHPNSMNATASDCLQVTLPPAGATQPAPETGRPAR